MGQIEGEAVFAPLIVTRIVSTLVIGTVVLVTHAPWRLSRPALLPATLAGTLDMSGNVWYLFASQQGRLDVAAVLASLYPVVTVLLAATVLKEHIGRLQAAGIVAALAAIVLIAS
jgi:drug/metabolite transporter (DMT)-like permease